MAERSEDVCVHWAVRRTLKILEDPDFGRGTRG